jgi:hypothetical protein
VRASITGTTWVVKAWTRSATVIAGHSGVVLTSMNTVTGGSVRSVDIDCLRCGEDGGLEVCAHHSANPVARARLRRAVDARVQALVLGALHVDHALDERLVEAVAEQGGPQLVERVSQGAVGDAGVGDEVVHGQRGGDQPGLAGLRGAAAERRDADDMADAVGGEGPRGRSRGRRASR